VTRADSLSWGKLTTSNFQVYVRRGEHFLLVSDRDFILHMINRELAGYASCQSQPPLCFVETVNGEPQTANGEPRTANGERRTANGER
jgi:hypothetical protein